MTDLGKERAVPDIWTSKDLAPQENIVIPSVQNPEGAAGVLGEFRIAVEDQAAIQQKLKIESWDQINPDQINAIFQVHIRSRWAQVGLDGELESCRILRKSDGSEDGCLCVEIRLYSLSSHSILIEKDQTVRRAGFFALDGNWN